MAAAFLNLIGAYICDLTEALLPGWVDLSPWRDELLAQNRQEEVPVAPRKFEAYTDCPKCKRLDVHWIREPEPTPTESEMQAWRDRRTSVDIG